MKKRICVLFIFLISLISLSSCTTTVKKVIVEEATEIPVREITSSISKVYEDVYDGCVGVLVGDGEKSYIGSGVIYKYDSNINKYYVVTNAHVVENMTEASVYTGNDVYYEAEILGYDTKNDIGVIVFEANIESLKTGEKENLKVIDFLNYDKQDLVTVGSTVLAIGNPIALSNHNLLTTGVVSKTTYQRITTDCALNPGNSGGGAFDLNGQLIGIVNARAAQSSSNVEIQNIGYIISLDIVKESIIDIEKNGVITRPMMGIVSTSINTLISSSYEEYKEYLPVGSSYSYVIVTTVLDDSNAKNAGIELYDVILEINNKKVYESTDITDVLTLCLIGDSINLKIYRSSLGNTVDITVNLVK